MEATYTKKPDMVGLINRNKKTLQSVAVMLGLLFLGMAIYSGFMGPHRFPANSDRFLKGALNGIAKPAEIFIFPVVGLYAVRLSLKRKHDFKELARWVFRLLQVLHIPLASVVVLAATVHGVLYTVYLWRSDFHDWSGVAALGAMLVVTLLGLLSIKGRKYRYVHLVTGLVAFGLAAVHMFI